MENDKILPEEHHDGTRTPCTPQTPKNRDLSKLRKADKKRPRSQSRVHIVSAEDAKRIADAIHPNSSMDSTALSFKARSRQNSDNDSLANSSMVLAESDITAGTKKSTKANRNGNKITKGDESHDSPAFRSRSSSSSRSHDEPAIGGVLDRLHVPAAVVAPSKERKELLAKLQTAIVNDLKTVENEERETSMRRAGYFRYINRHTYNAMMRNNEIWDWESGCKLKGVAEDVDESEADEDEEKDEVIGVEDYTRDFVFDEVSDRDGGGLVLVDRTAHDHELGDVHVERAGRRTTAAEVRSQKLAGVPTTEPLRGSPPGTSDTASGVDGRTPSKYALTDLQPESIYPWLF